MISFQAPGSAIVFGEHSVLNGFPAIVAAVDQWIKVHFLVDKQSTKITIDSALGAHSVDLKKPNRNYPPCLNFVCVAIEHCPPPFGGRLSIEAEFPDNIGLGSSATVCVATLACMHKANNTPIDRNALLKQSINVIHSIQKIGSGADALAAINGNMLLFDPQTLQCQKLPNIEGLSLHYCGYKTKTAKVVQHVSKLWQGKEEKLKRLYEKMGALTESIKANINNPEHLTKAINTYHHLLIELGVEDETLQRLRQKLLQQGASAVKISGSGLGDCLLAFNHPMKEKKQDAFTLKIASKGLHEIA